MQHLIRHTFYVYSCHFPLIVYISQWCTITLSLLRALLVNVGRSDKKDSCGALYFEKVSSLSIEGTQPLSVSSCWFYLSSPGRQLYKTLCISENCLREREHSNSTELSLTKQPDKKERMVVGGGQDQDCCVLSMTSYSQRWCSKINPLQLPRVLWACSLFSLF